MQLDSTGDGALPSKEHGGIEILDFTLRDVGKGALDGGFGEIL